MRYEKDDLIPNLMSLIAIFATIAADIALKVTGRVQINIIVYIIICFVLVVANCCTYLPLYTIAFILLKVMGRLSLGWIWIIFTMVIDLLTIPNVQVFRSPTLN